MAEAGYLRGILLLLLLLLNIVELLAAVEKRDWVFQVTPLQPWWTQSLHVDLESVVTIAQFLVLLYPICTGI